MAAIVATVAAAPLIAFELLMPGHLNSPVGRGAIETVVIFSSLFTAALLVDCIKHGRQLRDVLLLGAIAALALGDFPLSALPTITGAALIVPVIALRMTSGVAVALALAAAALVRSDALDSDRRFQTEVGGSSRAIVASVGVIGTMAIVQMVALVVAGQLSSGVAHEARIASGLGSPVVSAVNLLAAGLLVGAGVAILARGRECRREAALFAGAAFLLAGVSLQYFVVPAVAAGWITAGSALKLVAYGLLLVVARQRHAKLGDELLDAARADERQRLARDLHDGLAQDLAVIALYGQRLQSELAPDHPLIVASRRALAASRGLLADLSASSAPDTVTALEEVASELAARFNLVVDVRVQGDDAHGDELDLGAGEREEIVRIAREAVVNAARHGGARRVDISLDRRDAGLHLTVLDDGCGISKAALDKAQGFGLPTMRARAESLGGRLTAAPRARGGTKLAVVVPPAMPGNRRARR